MDYKKTNPAVIKSMLMQMDKQTFIKHAKEIKTNFLNAEVQTNERAMFLNLYNFCVNYYLAGFKKR